MSVEYLSTIESDINKIISKCNIIDIDVNRLINSGADNPNIHIIVIKLLTINSSCHSLINSILSKSEWLNKEIRNWLSDIQSTILTMYDIYYNIGTSIGNINEVKEYGRIIFNRINRIREDCQSINRVISIDIISRTSAEYRKKPSSRVTYIL